MSPGRNPDRKPARNLVPSASPSASKPPGSTARTGRAANPRTSPSPARSRSASTGS